MVTAYLLDPNANPLVALAPYIEVAVPVTDVSDLLVLVQMLREERLDLLLVHVTHRLRRDSNLVPVPVPPLAGQLVHPFDIGEAEVCNAKVLQFIHADCVAGVVR